MLIYSLDRLNKSDNLPIDLNFLKTFLKIDHALEDDLLRSMIKAAVDSFEDYTSIALLNQLWRVIYKEVRTSIIELPIKPVIDIISASMSNMNHKSQPVLDYRVLGNNLYLNQLPITDMLLIIEFQAGFEEDKNPISENIKLALLDHIAFLYENRGCVKKSQSQFYSQFRTMKF